MRIYTASAFANRDRVKAFNQDLRGAGHEVTYDWAAGSSNKPDDELTPEMRRFYADQDRDGVLGAELVVFLFDEGRPYGGLIELGGAAFAGIQCWVLRPTSWTADVKLSIFYDLPNVEVVQLEDTIRARLGMTPLNGVAYVSTFLEDDARVGA